MRPFPETGRRVPRCEAGAAHTVLEPGSQSKAPLGPGKQVREGLCALTLPSSQGGTKEERGQIDQHDQMVRSTTEGMKTVARWNPTQQGGQGQPLGETSIKMRPEEQTQLWEGLGLKPQGHGCGWGHLGRRAEAYGGPWQPRESHISGGQRIQ